MGEDMHITGSPVSTSFQVKDLASEAPGQQAAAGTKGASDWSASGDKQKTQASSEGNTAGESLDGANTRTKRGFKGGAPKFILF